MIVVDSSVWIDYFKTVENEQTWKLREMQNPEEVILGDIVLFEVLRGAKDEAHARRLDTRLRLFRLETMLDHRIARQAATNYRHLQSLGITVRKFPDMLIGTFCVENGHHLLHRDRDFAPMVKHLGLMEL